MIIHGINKLTLLDYPEHTACTLFTGGCSFRCPFCQNSALILHPDREPVLDMDWLFAFLNKRKRVLQGVCITGGEPTLQKDLPDFIRKIRELGYKIKLDTNGYHPEAVAALLQDELLDAVAMDIKSSPDGYHLASGLPEEIFDISRIQRTVEMLMAYPEQHPDFYYEFRTTLVKGIHTEKDMAEIGHWLRGTRNYFLQHYEDSEGVLDRSYSGFSLEETEHLAQIVRKDIKNVRIRGLS